MKSRWLVPTLVAGAVVGALAGRAPTVEALDYVEQSKGGKTTMLTGQVVTEAEDGGLLLMTSDGALWAVQPDEIVTRRHDDVPFQPLKRDEMIARLQAELPAGFKFHTTANYIICYNTSTAYAQWCGSLYERLYRGFRNYWQRRGVELHDPALPLVALVFDGQESYVRHVRPELGEAAGAIVGFYSPMSNRVNMYDLTGVEELRLAPDRNRSAARINEILSKPAAAPTVATIVHEATHQLAYNCGLQTRLADNPVWVSEGVAMYFETPDMKNAKGWSSIGTVNRTRLLRFREYSERRGNDSLVTLLQDDRRFRDKDQAIDAYAESWALNYFLLKTRSDDYVAYLRELADKPPSVFDTPAERLALFRQFMGDDLVKLDTDFVRYMRRLSP